MSRNNREEQPSSADRRTFLSGAALSGAAALGAAGVLASTAAQAEVKFPKEPGKFGSGGTGSTPANGFSVQVNRSENTLYDCEVEGKLPDDLNGAFYRVGPDAQYPKPESLNYDIGFDGEGHASMFRIQNGHVDYLSRWVKNDRWKAQHKARKSLYGVYRNPYTDDPSVKGLSRGTQNTQVWYHNGRVLAMKEDTMPAALDPHTLETLDSNYKFDGKVEGQTFTAHPKNDSHTGDLLAFGYEARGLGSTDINIFQVSPQGKTLWQTWVKAPYCSEIHDYAITEKHIVFLVYPLAYLGEERMKAGGLHWGWDSTKDTYIGVLRRGGDGKDVQWLKGPTTMCTHVMGCWTDGDMVYVDMDGGDANQFPMFPNIHEPFDPVKAQGRVRRFSVDTSKRTVRPFDMKVMYPQYGGGLARQDDRYHTVPYRYGFLIGGGPGGGGWLKFDHQTGKVDVFNPGPDAALSEMCFVPRRKGAPEGDGYLVGLCARGKEAGRSDLLVVDAQHMSEGAIATIKLPYRAAPQVHGFWVPGDQLPAAGLTSKDIGVGLCLNKEVNMGNYVDGFVVPVPKKKRAEYIRMAKLGRKVWLDNGALEYRECMADDVKPGKVTSFPQSVKLRKGEEVWFSWIVYRSRRHRDAVMKKVMSDSRMAAFGPKNMPFDGKRMFFGGFTVKVSS